MRELAALLDDIICSSTTGVFKAESPEAFFGPWLDASCLRFEDALLIDDRSENCDAFVACGGSAVHWRAELHDRHLALAEVRAWIDDEPMASTVSTAACTAASCRAPAASVPARPSLPARRLVGLT
jgi:FMN phosphatase YigB (HAD superfamily)